MASSCSRSGRCSNLSERRLPGRSRSSSGVRRLRSSDELSEIMQSLRTSTENYLNLLAGPINRLELVLEELIDYRVAAVTSSSTAWKLTKWLDEDPPVEEQVEALSSICNSAQSQACHLGLLTCPKLIRKLTEILQTTKSPELLAVTARCLQLLAKTQTGAHSLLLEFGVPSLVQLLRHPARPVHNAAAYILNQLLWYLADETRPEFRACEGQNVMAELLAEGRLHDTNTIISCVDSIRMATYRCTEAKSSLLETNLHSDLIRLMRVFVNRPKLAYNITRLVKVLSTCPLNKTRLVECGAVEALSELLQSDHEFLQLECLWSLRNLSDRACHLTTTRGLILRLSELLASRDENISICSIGCLCNFTCKNAYNKGLLVETGGVARLCQLLNLNPNRQEITEPICSALRHATHRSPHTASAIFEIRSSHALPVIASLLQHDDCTTVLPLIKAVVGLVRNLASDKETQEVLKSHGVVRSLARILKQTTNTIHRMILDKSDGTGPLLDLKSVGCIEGVRLEEMLELCLIALHAMAKDSDARDELLHTAGVVVCVIQLLYTSSEVIQRAALSLLNQLASNKLGVDIIEQQGACSRLTELIQSQNEQIAAYSAAVLHRITANKPADYRRRISSELRQALFDGGIMSDQEHQTKEQHMIAEELLKHLEQSLVNPAVLHPTSVPSTPRRKMSAGLLESQ